MKNIIKTFVNFLNSIDISKLTIVIFLLSLSLFTRFYPPVEPSQGLVFDESYFVPQVESYVVNRYFFDPHPHLARMFMYYGLKIFNPDALGKVDADKLGNKVDNYKTQLNLNGIRLFPRIFGAMVPVILFLLAFEILNWRRKNDPNYFFPLMVSLLGVFENIYIVESRYALITQFLIFFILLTIFFAIKYYKAPLTHFSYTKYVNSKRYALRYLINSSNFYLLLTFISFGLAFSTKWFSASVLPFILILICVKQSRQDAKYIESIMQRLLIKETLKANVGVAVDMAKRKMELLNRTILIVFGKYFLSVVVKVGVLILISFSIYSLIFAWHFSKMKNYSPAADEVSEFCPAYLDDLKNRTNNADFFCKLYSQFELSNKYQKYVPELDFTKTDEIGSKWITWPIMARTISYYWQTGDSKTYSFAYLLGNPINWLFGLLGVVILSAKVITDLLEARKLNFLYILLLLLFFANWLPYALISRVMYLYHYIPALTISLIIFVVVLNDLIIKRFENIFSVKDMININLKKIKYVIEKRTLVKAIIFCLVLLLSVLSFFYYYNFTYVFPLNKDQFMQRYIIKDWDMKWPGND